ncbi:hypothetical protein AB0M22_29130 [Nocardia sp. NPDC051756]|uniref:hypothetical protein n=1 Tax=Nocardia sp. NPDC051756 TaxID=3154751 RepID=UPI003448B891
MTRQGCIRGGGTVMILSVTLAVVTGCGSQGSSAQATPADLVQFLPQPAEFPAGYRVTSPPTTTGTQGDDSLSAMTLDNEACRPLVATTVTGRHAATGLANNDVAVAYLVEIPEPDPDLAVLSDLVGRCKSIVAESDSQRISFEISTPAGLEPQKGMAYVGYRITGVSESVVGGTRSGNIAHFVQQRMIGRPSEATAGARVTITGLSGEISSSVVDENAKILESTFGKLSTATR